MPLPPPACALMTRPRRERKSGTSAIGARRGRKRAEALPAAAPRLLCRHPEKETPAPPLRHAMPFAGIYGVARAADGTARDAQRPHASARQRGRSLHAAGALRLFRRADSAGRPAHARIAPNQRRR